MRKYEEIRSISVNKILAEITCDLCGAKGKYGDWTSSSYDVKETEIKVTIHQKEGVDYGCDGGWGTEIIVDMCPTCFKEKFWKWLQTQSNTITEREWEF